MTRFKTGFLMAGGMLASLIAGGCESKSIEKLDESEIVISIAALPETTVQPTTEETTTELQTEEETESQTETETETETESETVDEFEVAEYGLVGLEIYKYGDKPNALGDVSQIGYMPAGSYDKDGQITDFQMYDTEDGLWLASFVTVDGDVKKGKLIGISGRDFSICGNVTTFAYNTVTDAPISYSIENVGKDFWYTIGNGLNASATRYSGSAQRHNVISVPDNVSGKFRDVSDTYYYVSDGKIGSVGVGVGAAAVEVDGDFVPETIEGIFEYPIDTPLAIVSGTDEKGNEAAIIDLKSGEIKYAGDMEMDVVCDNNSLFLSGTADDGQKEIKYYHPIFSDAYFRAPGEIHAQLLSDGTTLIYYISPYAEGAISYHVFRLSRNHELLQNSRFEAPTGSVMAGEAVKSNEEHIIFPLNYNGSILFYEWDLSKLNPELEQLTMGLLDDAKKFK